MTSVGSARNSTPSGLAGQICTTTGPPHNLSRCVFQRELTSCAAHRAPPAQLNLRGTPGAGIAYYGGDGNYYAGDTRWHRDVFNIQDGEEGKSIVRHIKIAFYLDPLTATTGALRVIPGSHHLTDNFAKELDALLLNRKTDAGVLPQDAPAVSLTTTPGDIVIFDHRMMHASFGGGPARRMFAMNLFEQCHTSRQRELTARLFHMYGSQGMSYFFSDNVTKGAPRDRARRLEPALEFEPARAEGYAEYSQQATEPHRIV